MNSVLETLKSIKNKIDVTCSSKIIFLPNLRLIYYNIHPKLFKKNNPFDNFDTDVCTGFVKWCIDLSGADPDHFMLLFYSPIGKEKQK